MNVTALCASVLAPTWGLAPEHLATLPQLLINFGISGGAGTLAFYQALAGLQQKELGR